MILWCDGPHDVEENMRRDRALLGRCRASAGGAAAPCEPVLRLFGFTPPGITLGTAQDPEQELDLLRCRRDGVGWAVRPTGGRAIFHDEEWTYSLSARIDDSQWGGSLSAAYRRASALVVASLQVLGLTARFASGAADVTRPRLRHGPAAPCFASTARHEILGATGKLVGSAQRRTGGALLQQGSVLLGPAHLRLADYLAVPDERREAIRARLAAASAWAGAPWRAAHLPRWAEALHDTLGAGTPFVAGDAGIPLLTAASPDPYAGAEDPSPATCFPSPRRFAT